MSLYPAAESAYRSSDDRTAATHNETHLFSEVAPVYLGAARLCGWNQNSRTGICIHLRLMDVERTVSHPFSELRWSNKPGDGHRLRVALNVVTDDGIYEHVFGGEATLRYWAVDCANGVSVKLWLDPSPSDSGERRNLQDRHADPKDGDVFSFGCWAIGDDEKPQVPHVVRRKPRLAFAEMDATVQAGIKCGDQDFHKWCLALGVTFMSPDEAAALPAFAIDPRGFAEGVVRNLCRVGSRSELKAPGPHGDDARHRWSRILINYGRWRADRNRPAPPQGN